MKKKRIVLSLCAIATTFAVYGLRSREAHPFFSDPVLSVPAPNPFKIDVPVKEELTEEDYSDIEKKLRAIDISPFIRESIAKQFLKRLIAKMPLGKYTPKVADPDDFLRRISKGLSQNFLDRKHRYNPSCRLVRIGKGGDRCLVSYATMDGKYVDMIQSLPELLEKTGFNGYFFYRIGGYPNPTGKEIRYAGVPYAFKIFSLLEAKKLGFSKVLWIDSALVPVRDPSPLFVWLEYQGYFFNMAGGVPKKYILPETRDFILRVTGVDLFNKKVKKKLVSAQVFGFDLERPFCQDFIADYYRMVEMGFPFFSCFPEESVFSAILLKKEKHTEDQPYKRLTFREGDFRKYGQKGYFFLQRDH